MYGAVIEQSVFGAFHLGFHAFPIGGRTGSGCPRLGEDRPEVPFWGGRVRHCAPTHVHPRAGCARPGTAASTGPTERRLRGGHRLGAPIGVEVHEQQAACPRLGRRGARVRGRQVHVIGLGPVGVGRLAEQEIDVARMRCERGREARVAGEAERPPARLDADRVADARMAQCSEAEPGRLRRRAACRDGTPRARRDRRGGRDAHRRPPRAPRAARGRRAARRDAGRPRAQLSVHAVVGERDRSAQ